MGAQGAGGGCFGQHSVSRKIEHPRGQKVSDRAEEAAEPDWIQGGYLYTAFVKAAARDIKAYLKGIGSSALVAYAATDGDATFRNNMAQYMSCGDESTVVDLYGAYHYDLLSFDYLVSPLVCDFSFTVFQSVQRSPTVRCT